MGERLTAMGKRVVSLREPGGTPLGDEVRRLLLDPASEVSANAEALLFMASRAQLVEREIKPALAAGAVVILDRFFLSTYAYQVAGRGLPEADVVAANTIAIGGLRPDLNVILGLPADVGMDRATKRGPRDRMEQSNAEFHRRVSGAFEQFVSAEWLLRHPEVGGVVWIRADGSVEEVHARVLGHVRANVPALQ